MEHIYIFDYCTSNIYHGRLLSNESYEDFLEAHNLKESCCEVLITETEQKIIEL